MADNDSKSNLSCLNKLVDQCSNTYDHSIGKEPINAFCFDWKNWGKS